MNRGDIWMDKLAKYIGTLDAMTMSEISKKVMIALGLE